MFHKKAVVLWGTRVGFAVFFLMGIVLANLWFPKSGVEENLISESALLEAGGWSLRFFVLYLFCKRLPLFAVLFLFSRSRWKAVCFSAAAAWQGFAIGYLAANLMLSAGFGGLWYDLRILFPHYFLYAAVFCLLLRRDGKSTETGMQSRLEKAVGTCLIFLIFAAGVLLEGVMDFLMLIS